MPEPPRHIDSPAPRKWMRPQTKLLKLKLIRRGCLDRPKSQSLLLLVMATVWKLLLLFATLSNEQLKAGGQLTFPIEPSSPESRFSNYRGKPASALSIQFVEVPSAVMNSSQVTLVCRFDLQGDQLYSVKWYKNYVEFYRYQPGPEMAGSSRGELGLDLADNSSSRQAFELDGINVNISKSNATHVHLKQVGLASEGTYKCEVSADAPSFATTSLSRRMSVFVLPRQKLRVDDNNNLGISQNRKLNNDRDNQHQQNINGNSHDLAQFTMNELVNLTCTSGFSRPPAKLSWLLNDSPLIANSLTGVQLIESKSTKPLVGSTGSGQPNLELTETKLTVSFRLQPALLSYGSVAASNWTSNQRVISQSDISTTSGQIRQFKLVCVARLKVEFGAETGLVLTAGRATPKRRSKANPSAPEAAPPTLPLPSSLLPLDGNNFGDQAHLTEGQMITASQYRTTIVQVAPIVASGRSNHQMVSVWTGKQLRSHADHIEAALRSSKPNEIDEPQLGVALLPVGPTLEPAGSPEDSVSQPEVLMLSPSVADDPQPEIVDYELNDLLRITCHRRPPTSSLLVPRGATPDTGIARQIVWMLNGHQLGLSPVINYFDGHQFGLINAPSSRSTESDHPIDGKEKTNKQNNNEFLLELSPSVYNLKELEVKCRTLTQAALIDYEYQIVGEVQPANLFIQAPGISRTDQPNSSNRRPQTRRQQLFRVRERQRQSASSSQESSLYQVHISSSSTVILVGSLMLHLLAHVRWLIDR